MSTLDTSPDGRRYGRQHLTEAEVRADLAAIADDEPVGITPTTERQRQMTLTDWNEDFDPQKPSLVDLERQALKAANWRGHTMSPYERTSSHQSYATCTKCGRGAYCDTKPMPNGIDIHGEAVALNCND